MGDELFLAAGVAAYRWGSLVLETTSLAPADGEVIVRALASSVAGGLVADSEAKQRGTIAVMHELVHLQQDLATGLGAWDHLTTRTAYPMLADGTRWLITKLDPIPYRSVAAKMLTKPVIDPDGRLRAALDAIRERTVGLRALAGGAAGGGQGKTLRMMLEGEAACVVHRHVTQSRFDDLGLIWIDDHQFLWHVLTLGGVYADALVDVATAWFNRTPSGDELVGSLGGFIGLVPWLVDLACAFPPPGMLGDRDPADFDPVARYLVLLRGVNKMSERDGHRVVDAVVSGDWVGAEAILRPSCEVDYPSTTELYTQWVGELTPLAESGEWDAPLFELRRSAMRARLDGNPAKGPVAMLAARTPVQIIVAGAGIRGITHNMQYFDDDLRRAQLGRMIDMELFELFHGNGRFCCPYGRMNICDARQDHCSTGITNVAQLPPSPGCHIRSFLKDTGYYI